MAWHCCASATAPWGPKLTYKPEVNTPKPENARMGFSEPGAFAAV